MPTVPGSRCAWPLAAAALAVPALAVGAPSRRPRIRDLCAFPGELTPGPLDASIGLPGVRVEHQTLLHGESVRTGVTAILLHGGDLFRDVAEAIPIDRLRQRLAQPGRR